MVVPSKLLEGLSIGGSVVVVTTTVYTAYNPQPLLKLSARAHATTDNIFHKLQSLCGLPYYTPTHANSSIVTVGPSHLSIGSIGTASQNQTGDSVNQVLPDSLSVQAPVEIHWQGFSNCSGDFSSSTATHTATNTTKAPWTSTAQPCDGILGLKLSEDSYGPTATHTAINTIKAPWTIPAQPCDGVPCLDFSDDSYGSTATHTATDTTNAPWTFLAQLFGSTHGPDFWKYINIPIAVADNFEVFSCCMATLYLLWQLKRHRKVLLPCLRPLSGNVIQTVDMPHPASLVVTDVADTPPVQDSCLANIFEHGGAPAYLSPFDACSMCLDGSVRGLFVTRDAFDQLEARSKDQATEIASQAAKIAAQSVAIAGQMDKKVISDALITRQQQHLRDDRAASESVTAERDDQIAVLQKEKADWQKEKAGLQKEKTGLQKEKTALQKEKAGLQQENANLQKEKAELRKEKADLQKGKALLDIQVSDLTSELSDRKKSSDEEKLQHQR